jgi:hypothetical protein
MDGANINVAGKEGRMDGWMDGFTLLFRSVLFLLPGRRLRGCNTGYSFSLWPKLLLYALPLPDVGEL